MYFCRKLISNNIRGYNIIVYNVYYNYIGNLIIQESIIKVINLTTERFSTKLIHIIGDSSRLYNIIILYMYKVNYRNEYSCGWINQIIIILSTLLPSDCVLYIF